MSSNKKTKSKFKLSISKKLILTICSLLILSNLGIGLRSYMVAKNELDAQGKKMLKNSVEMALQLINAKQKEVKRGSIGLEEAQEEVKTYLLGQKEEDGTRPINREVDLGDHGYFFAYDVEGNKVLHPSTEGSNSWESVDKSQDKKLFAQEIIEKAKSGGGFTYYEWTLPDSKRTGNKITYSKLDPNWGWVVTAGSYMIDYNQGANIILAQALVAIAITFIIGAVLTLLFARHISRPMLQITEKMNEVSRGNFNVSPLIIKNKDETQDLSISFNQMVENTRELIKTVKSSSDNVIHASDSLATITEQTATASNEVALSIEEIAKGAGEQAKDTEHGVMQINELGKKIDTVTKLTQDMTDAADQTNHYTQKGLDIVTLLNEKSEKSGTAARKVNTVVLEVDKSTDEIGSIAGTIGEIAEQTNLLALNAAIEAARAGEHGQGFAVVAEEVRKLAEQSSQATDKVKEIIAGIQSKSKEAVHSMEGANQIVEEQTKAVQENKEIFNDIAKAIHGLAKGIEEIRSNVVDIDGKKDALIGVIENISASSEETSASTQQISASTEEQLAAIEEVTSHAQDLRSLAEELEEVINRFEI